MSVFCLCSIKSIFQLRTFDPEGTIFYGDTKGGEDWFVLSLKDGFPLMQISKEGMLLSVAGGPKLNDGKWHTVSLRAHLLHGRLHNYFQQQKVMVLTSSCVSVVQSDGSKQPREVCDFRG